MVIFGFPDLHHRQFERQQRRWSPPLAPSARCFGLVAWLDRFIFRRDDSDSESMPD